MRLWLRDSERRPDPKPVATNSRAAIFVGLGLWTVALLALLVVPQLLDLEYASWRLATCAVGVVLGLLGLIYLRLRKKA
jgi:hypothetical protein